MMQHHPPPAGAVASIMRSKKHLTEEGLQKIKGIKSNKNDKPNLHPQK